MATQQTLIAETIRSMKLALRRADNDSDSDTYTARHTNRGNKLKRAARFVHEGRLDTTGGRSYRRRVNHAGYQRYVIHDNPTRFDYDGDMLDDLDPDDLANASPNEDNPFQDTKLEHLLAPLPGACDLHLHPSLSTAYTNKNVTEMAERAREMLHREKALLFQLKHLLQRFRGDVLWAPLGDSETAQDQLLLDSDDIEPRTALDMRIDQSINSIADEDADPSVPDNDQSETIADGASIDADIQAMNGIRSVDMALAQPITNGVDKQDGRDNRSEHDHKAGDQIVEAGEAMDVDHAEKTGVQNGEPNDTDDPPSHAMTTRAKARTPPTGEQSPRSLPDSGASFSVTSINGFFLAPDASLPDRDFGLPLGEAEDTRRILILYVQKQEEIVRGTERLMLRLLEADRKRKDVWRWCKAEGHVGELSDGEDWYDREEWGLTEDLAKGKEEEDAEDEIVRKGRRRRDARKPQVGPTA